MNINKSNECKSAVTSEPLKGPECRFVQIYAILIRKACSFIANMNIIQVRW